MSKTVPKPNPEFSRGTGAVSAGPATFVRPRVQVPVATIKPSAPVAKAAAAPVPVLQPVPTYGFVYLLKRIMAYTIDSTVNLALLAGGLILALWNQDVRVESFMNPSVLFFGVIFGLIFNWALITAQEVIFSTSIGKRIFGLALKGGTGAILLRAFFFIPSLAFCGIGLAWGLFDHQRRCWHDLVGAIQPVEIARL